MDNKERIIELIQQANGNELEKIIIAVAEVIFSEEQVKQLPVHQTYC